MTDKKAGTTYSISELAQVHGLTLRALRFYEQRGLIEPLRAGRDRVYTEQDSQRLSMIVRGLGLGFTVTEVKDMLANSETGPWLDIPEPKIKPHMEMLEARARKTAWALSEMRNLQTRMAQARR